MIWLIVLLGLLFRFINLNQSLWLDEAISAQAVSQNSFLSLITNFSLGDFHPPLYYLFLKFWTTAYGISEVSLRLPSVFFGTITVIFVYLLGKKLFTKKIGLIAALFLAINPLAIYYSQEARMYALAMMLVAGSVYFLLERKWLWFVLFATASIYTDYLPALMFPVYFLLIKKKKLLLFPVVLFLPWLPYFFRQFTSGVSLTAAFPAWKSVLGTFNFKDLALTYVKFIFGRISFANKIIYGLLVAFCGAVYAIILSRGRNKLLWFWLLVPVAIGLIVSLKIPILTYFRFVFVLPAFILLLASGIRSRLGIVFVIFISVISLFWFNANDRFWREDWRELVNYVDSKPGLVIMPNLAQSAPLTYYQLKSPIEDINKINLDDHKNVYLLRYVPEIFDPNNFAVKTVEGGGYKFVENRNFNGVVIWRYEKT